MGKEPAGLRRWRLAHRKHKRAKKVYVVARRRRSYRGRKGKGKRSGKAIPILQTAILAYPILAAYSTTGFTSALPAVVCENLTGYQPSTGRFNKDTAIKVGGALILAQLVGSKIASRTGANKLMRKISMGHLKVA